VCGIEVIGAGDVIVVNVGHRFTNLRQGVAWEAVDHKMSKHSQDNLQIVVTVTACRGGHNPVVKFCARSLLLPLNRDAPLP